MSRSKKITITSIIAFAVLILLIIPKINFSESPESTSQASNSMAALPVKAYVVKPEKLANNVLTSGTILANEAVDLKSEVDGKIIKIAFKEGSRVKKGDLLVKINDAELQAQLAKAKFTLQLLEDKEFRQRQLLEKEAISQEEYDDALNQLNVNKSEVSLIEAQIDKTEIRAPFNGIIGLKNVSEGSYITSSTVIASMQNIDPIKIDFSVPEKYAGFIEQNDKIIFSIVGSEEEYTAKIYAVEPSINRVTRTLNIRAIYPNSSGKILPGSFAHVKLILDNIENALLVPTQAIVPELKGQKVYLYKSGRVEEQSVKIGIRTDTQVQITDGINSNDTVITSGILQIGPGMPVAISELK